MALPVLQLPLLETKHSTAVDLLTFALCRFKFLKLSPELHALFNYIVSPCRMTLPVLQLPLLETKLSPAAGLLSIALPCPLHLYVFAVPSAHPAHGHSQQQAGEHSCGGGHSTSALLAAAVILLLPSPSASAQESLISALSHELAAAAEHTARAIQSLSAAAGEPATEDSTLKATQDSSATKSHTARAQNAGAAQD